MRDAGDDGRPGDAIRDHVDANYATDWFLITGSRRLAALLIAVVFFGGLV